MLAKNKRSLGMLFNGLHKPAVLIRDDQVHSPVFQPSEKLAPAELRFAVSDLQARIPRYPSLFTPVAIKKALERTRPFSSYKWHPPAQTDTRVHEGNGDSSLG
jgi:hypothetical protein